MRKMFIINLILALSIILLSANTGMPPASTALSGDFYVSPEGSDRNPGTEEKPWKTIQKAANSVGPGSTVHIMAGTYYERVTINVSGVSAQEPVVFRNYQGDKVVIDGSQSDASVQEDLIHIANQSYVKLVGLEIANNVNEDPAYFVAGIGIWGKGEGIEIRNCKVHGIRYTGPAGKSGAHGIAVYGRDGAEPISGLIIDGCEIWDIQCGLGEAVALSGNVRDFQITGNAIHDNDNTGVALIGGGTFKGEPVCDGSDNMARNGFVGKNRIEKNSRAGNKSFPGADYGAAGIYADGAKDIAIAYNECARNDIGIMAGSQANDADCENIVIRNNVIYASNSCGIRVGGDARGGWASGCRVLNNTLYYNDKMKLGNGEISVVKSRDLLVSGNIFHAGGQNLCVSSEHFGKNNVYNIAFDNNLYYGPGGARGLRFKGADTGLVGLNMWKYHTKQDAGSKLADPKFADAARDDFRLLQNSPAIDLCDPAYMPAEGERDMDGNPRLIGKAVDCGAYEFILKE